MTSKIKAKELEPKNQPSGGTEGRKGKELGWSVKGERPHKVAGISRRSRRGKCKRTKEEFVSGVISAC